jgi:hypothetical protein
MVLSLSCPAAGDCAAGGLYAGAANHTRAFIASEDNGTWAQAEQVPGTASSGQPDIDAIACPAAGACVAVGDEEAGNAGGRVRHQPDLTSRCTIAVGASGAGGPAW